MWTIDNGKVLQLAYPFCNFKSDPLFLLYTLLGQLCFSTQSTPVITYRIALHYNMLSVIENTWLLTLLLIFLLLCSIHPAPFNAVFHFLLLPCNLSPCCIICCPQYSYSQTGYLMNWLSFCICLLLGMILSATFLCCRLHFYSFTLFFLGVMWLSITLYEFYIILYYL